MDNNNEIENVETTQEVESQENVTSAEEVETAFEAEVVSEESTAEQSEEVAVEKKQEKPVKQKKVKARKEKKVKQKSEPIDEYANLSEDELYAKIQTDKLLKRKKNKKIATLIGMVFAFALAACIIILAAVPVSLQPRCLSNEFASVSLYPGTTTSGAAFSEGSEDYEKFIELYNESFSQSYISAILSGSLSSYSIKEEMESTSGYFGSDLSKLSGVYNIRLNYAEEQVLTNQNGKQYESRYSTSKWDGKLTFTDACIVVNQTEGFQETKIYINALGYPTKDSNGNETTKNYLVTITLKANTYKIFEDWNDLV